MIELTEQQQKAVDAGPAPRVIDPRTQKAYVLVGADLYDRIRGILEEDDSLDMKAVAALVDRVMQEEDEGDPTLEFYQQKYGRKS